jgi:predicted phosphodiesterase
MRVAVISDMHGNAVAFEAVLDDLRSSPIDRVVCLGDAIQGGPQPLEVVSRLRGLGCPVVMGNADDWLLTGQDSGAEDMASERLRKMNEVRAWSLAQLSSSDLEFIRSFSPTVEIPLGDDHSLLCFHGSPRSYDDVILPKTPDEDVKRLLEPFLPRVLTGGHTHVQNVRQTGRSFYFNPGSAGFAYRHDQDFERFRADPWAEYAVLLSDHGRIALEFRRVPFDVDALVRAYRSSGRPHADEAIAQYAD